MHPVKVSVTTAVLADTEYTAMSLRDFEQYVAALSQGNPALFASELHRLLHGLNRSALRHMDRLEGLERLRPQVLDTCDSIVQGYRPLALPLADESRKGCALVMALLEQLAEGYKMAVNQRLPAGERPGPGRSAGLTLALQRALLTCGRSLLEHYRVYAPEPTEIWRDAHCLYANAESLRMQTEPFEAERDRDETALSIKQAYLRLVVLALANPYHLLQGEAEELYRRIGRWVHLVRLENPAQWGDLQGRFAVDLESVLPPHFRPRERRLPTPAWPRLLSVEALVDAVEERLEGLNAELAERSHKATLALRHQRDMYLRFREALGGRQERVETRQSTVAKVSVVAGLSGCHFFLNGRRSFTPDADETRWDQRLSGVAQPAPELSLSDSEYLSDPPESPGGRRSAFRAYDAEADDVWRRANVVGANLGPDPAARRIQHRAVTWNRKNVSSGGMALFCVDPGGMRVRVGDLMMFSEDPQAGPGDWRLAHVRWLRSRPDGGLEMGVRFIADDGHALGVKAVQGAGRDAEEYFRGILVPRVNPLGEEATLLTAAGVFEPGSVLRLVMSDLSLYVKLAERVQTSQLFDHFRYKLVEPPAHLRGAKS